MPSLTQNSWLKVTFWVCTPLLLVIFILVLNRELKSRHVEELLQEIPSQIVSQMSLQEKVGQLFHVGISGKSLNKATKEIIRKYKVGGVILFADNLGTPEKIIRLNKKLQMTSVKYNAIPLFISTDQEGGRVNRVGTEGTMDFPGAMALGQTANPIYAEEVGFVTGYELRKLGINWILAPVLDVNNNPKNPVINVRSFGSQPELVAKMGNAYIKGNKEALSLSAIKHFPGHGDTNVDSHLDLPQINKSLEELEAMELLPFRKAIEKGNAEVLMTAHILFPSLDEKQPATLSTHIIKNLLRKKLDFNGMVSTDAMEMKAISKRYKPERAAKLAFQASVDILLLTKTNKLRRMYKALLKGFQSQELSLEELDVAVTRQVRLKLQRGLLFRWGSPHAQKKPKWIRHWDYLERKTQHQYHKIQKKYKDQGIQLNTAIARDSIRSLRKPFPGLRLKDLDRVHLLVHSQAMRKQALLMGIPWKNIHKLRQPQDLFRILQRDSKEIWFIELDAKRIRAWNKLLVKKKDYSKSKRRDMDSATTIALYTGNPFLSIRSPQKGAVLISCSESSASRGALVYRALYPDKPVPNTDLLIQ